VPARTLEPRKESFAERDYFQAHRDNPDAGLYIGKPFYKKYDTAPIKLQAHGDKSEPISFRNIWVREIR